MGVKISPLVQRTGVVVLVWGFFGFVLFFLQIILVENKHSICVLTPLQIVNGCSINPYKYCWISSGLSQMMLVFSFHEEVRSLRPHP